METPVTEGKLREAQSADTPPNDPPPTINSWFRDNGFTLFVCVIVATLVFWRLYWVDVLLAASGLTLIIFLHELGHFAAAKFCKVRVEAFSIGFGPALPFCSYKYGETTYKLALVPLGGYVKMLGEGDGANDEGAETDPRSFKNQTVLERMFIISAGVIMNIILGIALFVIVYMNGLEEKPAVIAFLEPGGTAWRAGVRSGSEVKKIGTMENPWFDDIRPIVWSTNKGEQLDLTLSHNGRSYDIKAEPIRDEGVPFPLLGISPPESLQLVKVRRMTNPPVRPGSPAANADGKFLAGDTIVGLSDPDQPNNAVTPLPTTNDPSAAYFAYQRRLARLAGQPLTFQVKRSDGSTATLTTPPAFRYEVGAVMRMGPIVAVRAGSAAATSVMLKDSTRDGDRIVEVEIANTDKSVTIFTNDATTGRTVQPLDPMHLPIQLNQWADRTPGPKFVKLTVLRENSVDHTQKRETLTLAWDDEARFDLTGVGGANTPLPLNALGLAYQVQAVIDRVLPDSPAAKAGLLAGDTIQGVRIRAVDHAGTVDEGTWSVVKPHQWANVDALLQRVAPHEADFRVLRGTEAKEVRVAASVGSLPLDDRGLELMPEFRIQQATTIGEAVGMGAHRTIRKIREVYLNLYAMVFGRVNPIDTVSGPITLARVSYILAGESYLRLLLMLALVSINLAVVNFLPIPILDGGHMMFLTYEAFRGKPPPERIHTILTIIGLCCVFAMLIFVVGIDLYRLLKAWMRW